MKSALLMFFCVLLCSSFRYSNSPCDQILGNWISPEKDLIINCYKVNDQYFGKVVWFKKYYDERHAKNPVVPVDLWLNSEVMKHFVFKDNEWTDGEIFDLKSGKSYSSFIAMEGPDLLKCTGYVWLSIFGETIEFSRYNEATLPEFK